MKLQEKIKWISLLILLSLGMGQAIAQPVEVTGLAPEKELSDDSALKPGLLPIYIYKLFKSVDEMPKLDIKTTTEKVGAPILFLDHEFGKKDMVPGRLILRRSRVLEINLLGAIHDRAEDVFIFCERTAAVLMPGHYISVNMYGPVQVRAVQVLGSVADIQEFNKIRG